MSFSMFFLLVYVQYVCVFVNKFDTIAYDDPLPYPEFTSTVNANAGIDSLAPNVSSIKNNTRHCV